MKNQLAKRIAAATSLALLAAISVPHTDAFVPPASSSHVISATKLNVIGEQASSIGPAQVLRNLKETLPQISWLAEGDAPASNKIDIPDHVASVLSQPNAPKRYV